MAKRCQVHRDLDRYTAQVANYLSLPKITEDHPLVVQNAKRMSAAILYMTAKGHITEDSDPYQCSDEVEDDE